MNHPSLITFVSDTPASWMDVISSIVQIAVPIAGVGIAWGLFQLRRRDSKTAHVNLKLAVFKERFKVFDALVNLLRGGKGDWYHKGRIEFECTLRDVREFQGEVVSARFLFDEEVNEYIDSTLKKILDMAAADSEARDCQGTPGFQEPAKRSLELKKWLRKSVLEAEKVFHDSMSIDAG